VQTGGPGFEGPRPMSSSGWIKAAVKHYQIVLLVRFVFVLLSLCFILVVQTVTMWIGIQVLAFVSRVKLLFN